MLYQRKTFVFGLVLALFIALPCWSRGSSSTGSGAASSSNWRYQKGGPIAETPVTFSVLTHSGHAADLAVPNNSLPIYAAMMRRLGINVDWQILENRTYGETVNVRLMSRNLPDMVVGGDPWVFARMVEDGMFISYDDLNYRENAPYAQDLFRDPEYTSMERMYRSLYSDGKLYGFGATVVPRYLFVNLLFNIVWLNNLGLPEPSTVDELFNTLVAFRDRDPNGNGRRDELPSSLGAFSKSFTLGYAFGLDLDFGWQRDRDGRFVSAYTTDNYRDYLEFRKRLYDNDLVDKEGRDMAAITELVAQDRIGTIDFVATYSDVYSKYSPYYDENKPGPFREILPLRNTYNGQREKYARLWPGLGEPMFILKGARYPEVCLRFADWLWASPEYEMMMNFGIEGLSYRMVNGMPEFTPPTGYTGEGYLTSIGGIQPPWANRQIELAWRVRFPKWVIDRADEIKPFYVDPLEPVVPLTGDAVSVISRYSGDVNTYIDEMAANFISGRRPLSQFNQYVQELNNIGLDRLREAYQKYY